LTINEEIKEVCWGGLLLFLVYGHISMSHIVVSEYIYYNYDVELYNAFEGFIDYFKILFIYLLKELLVFFWSLLLIVPGIIKSYSYAMTLYIYNDYKDLSASECIKQSKKLMDGYKKDLFLLDLSYIGGYIISIFTLGIMYFYFRPRHEYARYLFYLKISGKDVDYDNEPIGDRTTLSDSLENIFENYSK
jgi:uncharacterized membrane protein